MAWIWSQTDENLSLGTTTLLVPKTFNFETWLPTLMGVSSNISLSSSFILNSCKYLKSVTHLWNSQVNKASSVNKGIVKICLVVEIAIASCGLHYFVSPRFGSFWFFANFNTVERFKYLFMGRIVKKQTDFIFRLLVT